MAGLSLRFERGTVGAAHLGPVISEAVRRGVNVAGNDLRLGGEASREGASALDLRDVVTVTESAQGADPLSTTILVSFAAGLSTELVMDLLRGFIYPALKDTFGHGALGRHVADVSDRSTALPDHRGRLLRQDSSDQ